MSQQPEFDGNAILAVLARHNVACVVIGNYAGLLHGVDLATEDVDITPATTGENLERLAAALAELDAAIRVPNEPPIPLPADSRLLAKAEIWNLTTRYGNLDLTTRPSGTNGYEDLRRNAEPQLVISGLRIDVASLQDVIRSKTAAGRAKDLAALPQLRAALEGQEKPAPGRDDS
jgi:hypothetical protein